MKKPTQRPDYHARAVSNVPCPQCGVGQGSWCLGTRGKPTRHTHYARRDATAKLLRKLRAAGDRGPCKHANISDIAFTTQWCSDCGAWRRLRTKEQCNVIVVAPAEWILPKRAGGKG